MEVTIGTETLIELAALLTALGAIGGAALWCVRFVARQKRQDRELTAIRQEQTVICFGVLACLKGLKEQGPCPAWSRQRRPSPSAPRDSSRQAPRSLRAMSALGPKPRPVS